MRLLINNISNILLRIISIKKNINLSKKRLKINDINLINIFLIKGFSLKESLQFIDNNDLSNYLNNGNHIKDYDGIKQKGLFYKLLNNFLLYTDLSNSITLANDIYTYINNTKKKIIKKCLYPVFISIISIITYIIFVYNLLPMMLTLLDNNSLVYTSNLLININNILLILILIFIIILIIIYISNKELLIKYISNNIIVKQYNSYMFTIYFNNLIKYGYSTKDSLNIINNLNINIFINSTINKVVLDLNEGNNIISIIDSYNFDNKFKELFRIGIYNDCIEDTLNTYITYINDRWDISILRLSIILQVISYSFVIIISYIMYQIMLLPLETLNTM